MKFPEQFRFRKVGHQYSTTPGDPFGAFQIPGGKAKGRALHIIANDGEEYGWEHVSVSLPDSPTKCPSWDEMCLVKDLFWDEEEAVMQIHPKKSEYVNHHLGCLHLWRPVAGFPTPDPILVGPRK